MDTTFIYFYLLFIDLQFTIKKDAKNNDLRVDGRNCKLSIV